VSHATVTVSPSLMPRVPLDFASMMEPLTVRSASLAVERYPPVNARDLTPVTSGGRTTRTDDCSIRTGHSSPVAFQ